MQVSPRLKAWLKRVGWLGFTFFLLKGIAYLLFGKFIVDWLKDTF